MAGTVIILVPVLRTGTTLQVMLAGIFGTVYVPTFVCDKLYTVCKLLFFLFFCLLKTSIIKPLCFMAAVIRFSVVGPPQ